MVNMSICTRAIFCWLIEFNKMYDDVRKMAVVMVRYWRPIESYKDKSDNNNIMINCF